LILIQRMFYIKIPIQHTPASGVLFLSFLVHNRALSGAALLSPMEKRIFVLTLLDNPGTTI